MTVSDHLNELQIDELVQPGRVNRRAYLDQDVFDEEMRRIFDRTWLYVGHESEISAVGDYKTTWLGKQPVILARREDGGISVLYNRCTHRAATVCQAQQGNANFFRCDYHGWTFRNDGGLIGATFGSGYDPQDLEDLDLDLASAPRVATYRGFIFASHLPTGPTLEEHLGNARPWIDLFVDVAPDGHLVVDSGRNRYGYDGNWKLQCENGVDGYHPNFVHQTYISASGRSDGFASFNERSAATSVDLGGGHGLLDNRVNYRNRVLPGLTETPQGQAYVGALAERLGDADRALEVASTDGANSFNLLVFPNLLLIGTQIRVIHPRSVSRTDVEVYPTLLGGGTERQNAARLRRHEAFFGPAGGGAPDDMEMFRRVTEGLQVESVTWLPFVRGRRRSQLHPDGTETGHVTDELPQRAFYREWRRLMATDG